MRAEIFAKKINKMYIEEANEIKKQALNKLNNSVNQISNKQAIENYYETGKAITNLSNTLKNYK